MLLSRASCVADSKVTKFCFLIAEPDTSGAPSSLTSKARKKKPPASTGNSAAVSTVNSPTKNIYGTPFREVMVVLKRTSRVFFLVPLSLSLVALASRFQVASRWSIAASEIRTCSTRLALTQCDAKKRLLMGEGGIDLGRLHRCPTEKLTAMNSRRRDGKRHHYYSEGKENEALQ